MSELKLSPEKQKEYDTLLEKMKNEIDQKLKRLPKSAAVCLDGPRSRVYREVSNKYLPQIQKILRSDTTSQ